MALSVLNNIAGIQGQNQLIQTTYDMQKTLFRLSSGLRITTGGDDAAGLQIADGVKAQIAALGQSVRNANDGVAMIQIADGALDQIGKMLRRAVVIAQQAQSGTVGSKQRQAIELEYAQIKAEIGRIASATTFNGTTVFGASVTVAIGDTTVASSITVKISSLSTSKLGLSGNMKTSTAAKTEITSLKNAISSVSSRRGNLGAYSNRLTTAANVILVQSQNLTAAESAIRDANMAEEVSNMVKYQILNQTNIAGLAQANQAAQSLLSLMR
jgi:flagellin